MADHDALLANPPSRGGYETGRHASAGSQHAVLVNGTDADSEAKKAHYENAQDQEAAQKPAFRMTMLVTMGIFCG